MFFFFLKRVFTERDRKFSESVPATEKIDKKLFLSPDHLDEVLFLLIFFKFFSFLYCKIIFN